MRVRKFLVLCQCLGIVQGQKWLLTFILARVIQVFLTTVSFVVSSEFGDLLFFGFETS